MKNKKGKILIFSFLVILGIIIVCSIFFIRSSGSYCYLSPDEMMPGDWGGQTMRDNCFGNFADKLSSNLECSKVKSLVEKGVIDIWRFKECLDNKATKTNNLSICNSCPECGDLFVSDCYRYAGLSKGSVEPCFYNNYLFSINYTNTNLFLNCYHELFQYADFKLFLDNEGWMLEINYLKNYCEKLSNSNEKIQCEMSLDYIVGKKRCKEEMQKAGTVDVYFSCMEEVAQKGKYSLSQ